MQKAAWVPRNLRTLILVCLASMKTLATEVVDTGEKRDTRGRRIVRAEERSALISAYEKADVYF